MKLFSVILIGLVFVFSTVLASEQKPWGTAKSMDLTYEPHKVLYDLTTGDAKELINILDRVGYLYKLHGSDPFDSSIVVIIHGDAIPFFAIDKYKKFKTLMARAQSLSVGTTIEFRMCRAAAKLMNYEAKDIHGFVTMVPMADAEIVRLQSELGYAYMH